MNILSTAINNTGRYNWSSKKHVAENEYTPIPVETGSDKFEKKANKKIAAASVIGTLAGIAATVGGIYTMAKRKNPAVSLKNLNYEEKDVILLGAGSILGGLAGGLLADKNKENHKLKLREASQQFFGNVLCPVGLLAGASKLLEKSGFKMPQLKGNNKFTKAANVVLSALPKMVVTIVSLVGGMEIGNAVIHKINNKVFKEEVEHDVKAEDYLLHADDLCLTANLLLKDAEAISKVTSKVLPLTFVVAGSKTGMYNAESEHH